MTDMGIRARILWLALTPCALVALVLFGFFVSEHKLDTDDALRRRGETLALHLALAAEYGLSAGHGAQLNGLLNSARDNDEDIAALAVFDAQHHLVEKTGTDHMVRQLALQGALPTQVLIEKIERGIRVHAPVRPLSSSLAQLGLQARNAQAPVGYVAVLLSHEATSLRFFQRAALAMLIVLATAALGAWLALRLARRVIVPVIQMAQAVNRMRDGQLDIQLATRATGELKVLENGLVSMARAMKSSHDEMQAGIEQATSDLENNNKELERRNMELDGARREALEASRIKSEFLANMSHEIRTPLNGVIGFTRLLLKTELNEKQREFLGTIQKSSQGLLALINDILDFSKVEAGKLVLENSPLELRELIDDVLTLLAPHAAEKHLELVSLIYNDVPDRILGDALRIRQVLTNLLSNAIKFTPSGSIELRVMLDSDPEDSSAPLRLCMQVRDTGIGMTAEQKQQLFQAFSQADSSTTRKFGGSGLGLVICKKYVEHMGGDIGVDSEPGAGSTFWFTISCDRPPASDAPRAPLPQWPHTEALVLEPHATARLCLSHLLTAVGVRFTVVNNIAALEQALAQAGPAVRILIASGESNDPDQYLLPTALADARQRGIATLCATRSADTNSHQALLQLGFDRCLTKPLGLRRFALAMQDLLSRADAAQPESGDDGAHDHLSCHVLAVDDNDANLLLVAELLQDLGARVSVARSGREALQTARDHDFDLVLMDIQMPEMDGVETLRHLRADPRHRETPILALTAHAMPGERERLLRAGMDDYLSKPVSEEALRNALVRWRHARVRGAGPDTEPGPATAGHAEAESADSEADLDWSASLKLANGKTDLAQRMLDMLIASLPEVLRDVHDAASHENWPLCLQHVHKFHGACCYVGVPALRAATHALETALKTGAPDRDQRLQHFHAAAQRLLTHSPPSLHPSFAAEKPVGDDT